MLGNVAKALKPNGRIGIVEFKKDGFGPGSDHLEERIDPERVIRDAGAAGLKLVSRENFLRYQYMLVFSR
jgi:predicted methyltransferase